MPHLLPTRSFLAISLCACFALACSSDDDDDAPEAGDSSVSLDDAAFTLQLLHVADMDGTSGALDNVAPFSSLVDHFRTEFPDNTVFLSSGDNYIPGPRFFAASAESLADELGVTGDGRADMAFLNSMRLDASAVGNHELDQGTGVFASLVSPETVGPGDEDGRPEGTYPGAGFPYLSANLDFSADENLAALATQGGQPASSIAGRLAPSATIEVDGEIIGVVGATTPTLAGITSAGDIGIRPADAGDVDALAAEIQTEVNVLVDADIDKIVLLSHMQQISVEQALASRLSGVDIIVAGGSNTLLADEDDTLRAGDSAVDGYPLTFTGADGAPVLLVNTEADYTYLGRLLVGFDENGEIILGTLDSMNNGAWASIDAVLDPLGATPNTEVSTLAEAVGDVLIERDSNILGRTAVFLDGRRSEVRTEETNMGNLTADANLWLARQVDPSVAISLKNGGGIRAPIGLVVQPPGTIDPEDVAFLPPPANPDADKAEGDISEFDIQGTLRFNNGLTLLNVTATELKDILEHAVAATEQGATPGRFPQVAGLTFSFDPGAAAREGGDTNGAADTTGSRVRNVAIVGDDGSVTDTVVQDGSVIGDPSRTFRLVILDFIASCVPVGESPGGGDCGDGYPLNGLAAPDRTDLDNDPGLTGFADPGSEQDALGEYLASFFATDAFDEAETDPADDMRIQNLSVRDDTVLTPTSDSP